MSDVVLETDRMHLRWWRPTDKDAWFGLSSDPRIMATLGPVLDRAESDAMMDIMVGLRDIGTSCFWAMERIADRRVIGFCGMKPGTVGTPVEGRVEIGWRLAADLWGQGYAQEAAAATLGWGWETLGCDSIWATTTVANHRSRALMERLGMRREPLLDFDHPNLAANDPLRPHFTYSIWNRP